MKARFNRLRIKNALSFASADVPLNDQGLVLIRGENLDEGGSNGSGKTNLFEILYNVFYDKLTKTERKVKKADLLNSFSPKDFLVRLDLDSDGVPYQVDKFRAHSKRGNGMSIHKSGVDITPDDPREVQKAVAALTGLTSNEFLGRVYLSQRHTHMMIEGTAAQKKEYLSRCFGWDTLDVMIKETTKRINSIPLPDESHLTDLLTGVEQDLELLGEASSLDEKLASLSQTQSSLQLKLVDLKVELSQQEQAQLVSEERRQWARTLDSKFSLDLDLETVKNAVKKRRKTVSSTREKLAAANKRVSLLAKLEREGDLPALDEDVDRKLEGISRRLSKLERDLPGVERRERLGQQLKALAPTEDKDPSLLEARTAKWKSKLAEVQERYSAVKSEVTKLTGVGDVCYTCLRPISSHEKEEMLRERREDLARLKDLVSKAQEALDHYSERLTLLQRRTDLLSQLETLPEGVSAELTETIESLQKEQSKIQRLSSQLARVQALKEQLSDLPEVEDSPASLEDQLASQEAKLEILEDAYQWVAKHGDVEFDPHALQRAQGAVRLFVQQLEEVNGNLLTVQESITRRQSLQKQKEDLTKTLNKASDEKSRHRVLRYLSLTLEELKRLSLRESTQLLSNVLPVYLNQLFPDGSIKLEVTSTDGFDLMFNKGGHSIPLTLISGGQAKRVGIAIVFSFAKMGRNTTNLLICDEPFRDLDPKGREACFELLRDFDMGTILVTSHDQDMNSPRKYDQVWSVVMQNHRSRLFTS